MTTLVIGASGATGRLLVEQLLKRRQQVRLIDRSADNQPDNVTAHKNLSVIQASILDLSDAEMSQHVSGCDALASCLGHKLSFKGIFERPRRLVTDATQRLCRVVKENRPENSVRFVLVNTTGNSNRDLREQISFSQKCVTRLLRILLPPYMDNEEAADFLRTEISQNDGVIEGVAVRPDGLIDESEVTEYVVHPSPIRSAIFDAGLTSRMNVGDFMAELITDDDTWNASKGKMPVIYNKEAKSAE